MSNKTNTVRAILLDATECDRPEADNPDTIEISAADLQLILERHIKEPAQCLHQIAEPAAIHPDDAAVDALAEAMKAKLAKQRERGYGGWDTDCTQERLSELLRKHVDKGNPVDVANFCAFLLARDEGIAAAPQAVQPAVPMFWVRLCRGGMYEGPVHNNSDSGKLLREEKPGEWHPLYLHSAPAHPAEGVPEAVHMLDERAAFEASVQKSHYWEGIRENLFDRLSSGKYVVVGIERHRQTWLAALVATQPAAQGLDAQDAVRRYLWLREQHDKGDDSVTIFIGDEQHGPGHLDAQIDEAIAAQAKQGGAEHG